ncbi:hypothetical protein BSKO_11304 [Bryopsis sp. KO-2023]|nr:hypothetical protein BSKO_11304 [Bryopsis sp. KO-2023]
MIIAFLYIVGIGAVASGHWSEDTHPVSTCEQLVEGFHDSEIDAMVVKENIAVKECMVGDFPPRQRRLKIFGTTTNTTIDFRGMGSPLRLAEGALVSFEGLTILSGSSKRFALDFPFLAVEAASVTFVGVMFGYVDCFMKDGEVSWIPPKELLYGTQQTCSTGDGAFLVNFLQIMHDTQATFYILDSTFRCGVQGIDQLREDAPMSCPYSKSKSRKELGVAAMIGILAIAVACLLVCLLALAMILIKRKIRRKKAHAGKDGPQGARRPFECTKGCDKDCCNKWDSITVDDIQLGSVLGKGQFSTVYRGTLNHVKVAVKVFEHDAKCLVEGNETLEAYVSRRIVHPNVVKTYLNKTHNWDHLTTELEGVEIEKWESSYSSAGTDDFDALERNLKGPDENWFRTWLVMEYCDSGSLYAAIRQGRFWEDGVKTNPKIHDILLVAIDIAAALGHLHEVGVIHGDLKTQNVLLHNSDEDPKGYVCKVADFGFSRLILTMTHIETQTFGSVGAMPPELLKDGVLSPAADVYSFGIVLWELLAGSTPYKGKNHQTIVVDVVEGRRPRIPKEWPGVFKRLIRDCLQQRYHNRPNFAMISRRLEAMKEQPPFSYDTHRESVEMGGPGFSETADQPTSVKVPHRISWLSRVAGLSGCSTPKSDTSRSLPLTTLSFHDDPTASPSASAWPS